MSARSERTGRSSTLDSGMSPTLTADDVRALRTRAQLLAGRRATDVVTAVSAVPVQAQAAAPARLAVRARTAALRAADVDRAANEERTVVRTWLMRGTLHMVAAADVQWMVRLLGPVFAAAGRRRREQLHLDEPTCERALTAIQAVLAGSPPLTRADLVARIADHGVRIDPATQAPAHLLGYAAMRGLICRGPDLGGGEPTYVLLDEWVDAARSTWPDQPLAELARRYLAGHGPARRQDFQAWSGLPAAQATNGFAQIAGELRDIQAAGGSLSVLSTMDTRPPREPAARLLGHFDAYLLGFRDRGLILERQFSRRIQAGGGIIRPAVLVNGRVVGTWTLHRRGSTRVSVEPFEKLPSGCDDLLAAEADDVVRFLETAKSPGR
jgi:winged helix DNA-binding protein